MEESSLYWISQITRFFAVPFQIPGVYESLLKLKQMGVDITNQHLYEVQCNFYLNHLACQICLVPTLGSLIYNHGTDANLTIDLGFPFLFSRVIWYASPNISGAPRMTEDWLNLTIWRSSFYDTIIWRLHIFWQFLSHLSAENIEMFESKNWKSSFQNENVEIRIGLYANRASTTHTSGRANSKPTPWPIRVMPSLIDEDNPHHKF